MIARAIRLLALSVPAAIVPALAADFDALSTELFARVGAESRSCAEETKRLFRPTVRLVCATVELEFKEFKKTWKDATQIPDAALSGLQEATRWFRQGGDWRRRYYWAGQTPMLALFNVADRRLVLAGYDVHATCRERARQRRIAFRDTPQLQAAGLVLNRTAHVAPEFPDDARLGEKSGVVLLWAVVSPSGAVENLCVADASPRGYGFELAAMDAVGQWAYEPPMQEGVAVPAELLTRVTFELGMQELPYRALLDPFFAEP